MGESAGWLVGENISHITSELQKICFESAFDVGLFLFPDNKDVFVIKIAAPVRYWPLQKNIHLPFPILELMCGFGSVKLVWRIFQKSILERAKPVPDRLFVGYRRKICLSSLVVRGQYPIQHCDMFLAPKPDVKKLIPEAIYVAKSAPPYPLKQLSFDVFSRFAVVESTRAAFDECAVERRGNAGGGR